MSTSRHRLLGQTGTYMVGGGSVLAKVVAGLAVTIPVIGAVAPSSWAASLVDLFIGGVELAVAYVVCAGEFVIG